MKRVRLLGWTLGIFLLMGVNSSMESQKGQYNFWTFDRLLEQMTEKDVHPLFILDYGNPLYGGGAVRTEESRAAFARFAAAAAARYKGMGVAWELWNEPNLENVWPPKPNPYEYMQMVIEAATAMRLEDPDAYIIGPGVSTVDFPYLEACIKAGLLRYVNAVSIHPYRSENPESAQEEFARLTALIQKAQPEEKPVALVVSEWGYNSVALKNDEQAQARYLARTFLFNAYAGVYFTIWYDFRNDGPDSGNSENTFGLYRYDGSPKPAVEAARKLEQQLSGRRFSRRLPSQSKDYLLEFVDGRNKPCVVAWTTGKDHEQQVEGQGPVELTQTPQYFKCRL